MEHLAGLAAFGFWLFLAAVVVSGIWFDARKQETQQETLRRVVESGQNLDAETIDRLMASSGGKSRPDRDLKVGGVITFSVAPGLVILGYFLSKFNDEIFGLMLGVSLLVAIIGIGLFAAGKMSERWYLEDQNKIS